MSADVEDSVANTKISIRFTVIFSRGGSVILSVRVDRIKSGRHPHLSRHKSHRSPIEGTDHDGYNHRRPWKGRVEPWNHRRCSCSMNGSWHESRYSFCSFVTDNAANVYSRVKPDGTTQLASYYQITCHHNYVTPCFKTNTWALRLCSSEKSTHSI